MSRSVLRPLDAATRAERDITAENVRRIVLDARLAGGGDGWETDRSRVAAVPGAVVSFLDVAEDTEGEGLGAVYGLVG